MVNVITPDMCFMVSPGKIGIIDEVAEAEGFEPPVPDGTTVFKTVALNHSATPPWRIITDDCLYRKY